MNGPATAALARLEAELAALGRWDLLGELVVARSRAARTLVVGRVGAGKTSLVRRLGGQGPVGLGGVTKAVAEWPAGERLLIDTVGIDDPDRAIDALGPLADHADEVLWVVDGLQPVTASERVVMPHLVERGAALHALVSRGDLIEAAEHGEITDRARRLGEPFGLRSVWIGDLRRTAPELALPEGFRDEGLRRVAASLPARLGVLTEPPAKPVRAKVHEALHATLALVEDGVLYDPAAALAHFGALAGELAADLGLPAPPREGSPDTADRWLGGKALTRRLLTQAAARVLAELEAAGEGVEEDAVVRAVRELLAVL